MSSSSNNTEFSPQSYLHFDAREGALQLPAGERMMVVPEGLLLWLQHALEDSLQAPGGHVLYRTGRLWGQAYAGMFERTIKRQGLAESLRELPIERFIELFDSAVSTLGLGRFVFAPEDDTLFVDLYGSALVHGLGVSITMPSCHVYAGFLAGFLGFVGGKPLAVSEIKCCSKNDSVCRFLVVPQEEIDAELFWRDEGVRMQAVLQALKLKKDTHG